jgi:serine/threonine protein kinase
MNEPDLTNVDFSAFRMFDTQLLGKTLVDRYKVISLLGRGGMSEVFKAEHLMMGRMVAIKAIRMVVGSEYELNLKRFQQEARVISRLKHPNIVEAFDFFWSEGQVFMVMEYLEGESLQSLLQTQHHLPAKKCLPLFAKICSALSHAHDHGIIHRDLKPANVMLMPNEEAKLLDFGVAKFLHAGEIDQVATQTGFAIGSPPYMSPEQCQGKQLDARSDLYSLGCLMYETLAGVNPVIGKNGLETIQRHLKYTPRRFSQVAPDLNIPEPVELMINKALQKSPDNRYQTANDLLQDLEALMAEKPANELIAFDCSNRDANDAVWFAAKKDIDVFVELDKIKTFAHGSFDALDVDGDGFVTSEELYAALLSKDIQWHEKTYLSFLLRRIDDIHAAYEEEWAPQHRGISHTDLQEYFEQLKRELKESQFEEEIA